MNYKASQSLPCQLYRAEQTRELDRLAIASGITGYELMRRAGRAAFSLLRFRWPRARRLLVLCGAGNNAGDGWVVARLAGFAGFQVQVITLVNPEQLQNEAAIACRAALEEDAISLSTVADANWDADVVVDALLGTGIDRAVSGEWLEAIRRINACGRPVLSLDIPSGINADTGSVMGAAVKAACTLSFIGLNTGLLTGAAVDYTGEVHFTDLDIPSAVYSTVDGVAERLDSSRLVDLPKRRPSDYKTRHGHVLVVAGSPGFSGAASLAGRSAVRAGAGLATVVTHPDTVVAVSAAAAEYMVVPWNRKDLLQAALQRASVAVIGPGLGLDGAALEQFARLVDSDLPLIVDADALTLLAENPQRRGNWILTPHPGEAARLLGTSIAGIESDRLRAAEAVCEQYGGACVLKGAGTIVSAETSNRSGLIHGGSAALATGGTGDVLAGVIGALVAQGLALPGAAALGAVWHAATSDWLTGRGRGVGQTAGDLVEALPEAGYRYA
ncbi:MAG: NAD(P)H-hydrate dehydratase [Gammaproteobacteria bacterium]|nr:NAD(P)H-hydrate dehydratase [Gammaproteobacteria bacterium]